VSQLRNAELIIKSRARARQNRTPVAGRPTLLAVRVTQQNGTVARTVRTGFRRRNHVTIRNVTRLVITERCRATVSSDRISVFQIIVIVYGNPRHWFGDSTAGAWSGCHDAFINMFSRFRERVTIKTFYTVIRIIIVGSTCKLSPLNPNHRRLCSVVR